MLEFECENPKYVHVHKADIFTACARKCGITLRKAIIIYLTMSLIVMSALLITVIVLGTSGTSNKCNGDDVCQRMPGMMPGGLNHSIEPCDDFSKYSCGIWLDKNPIPKSRGDWSVKLLEEDKIKHKIRTLINTGEFAEERNSVEYKVKRFYESCMATPYFDVNKDKTIFNELGGWSILETSRMEEFDFRRILRKIHSEYGANPFFKVEVVTDPLSPLKRIIQISPAGITLPDESYYYAKTQEDPVGQSLKTYIKYVLLLLGCTSLDAGSYAQAIFKYEGRIAQAMARPINFNYSAPANYTRISLQELDALAKSFSMVDLIRSIYPQGDINDHVEVIVTSLDFLKSISEIVSTTEERMLQNYLMWTLTNKYVPYLSKVFVDFVELQFRSGLIGSKENTPRWEFCIDETIKVFPPVINAMLANNCERRSEKVNKVSALFHHLKSSLSSKISESDKYYEKLKSTAVDKLGLMTINSTTPMDLRSLIDLFEPLVVQHNEFFSNVVQSVKLKRQLEQRDLKNPGTSFNLNDIFTVKYDPGRNQIKLPEALFQTNDLLEETGQNSAILHGTLGVQLAEVIASALGPKYGIYMANGKLMRAENPVYSSLVGLVEEKRACLQSFFTNIHLDDEKYFMQTSLDTTMHLAGIEIALDALEEDIEIKGEPSTPSCSYFEPTELFFIAYAQSQCSATTLEFHDMEHALSTRLSPEHRVRGLLSQLKQFKDAFKCPRISEKNVEFRCGNVF